jgi:type II secretory pathway component PulL
MVQDEVLKNQEISKEELASAVEITDATKAEIQEGVLEDTIEVDRMKQDEALFSRENVPEVRLESHRKPDSQLLKNWRLKELMIMLTLLLLQVDMVMARDNQGQGQVEQ